MMKMDLRIALADIKVVKAYDNTVVCELISAYPSVDPMIVELPAAAVAGIIESLKGAVQVAEVAIDEVAAETPVVEVAAAPAPVAVAPAPMVQITQAPPVSAEIVPAAEVVPTVRFTAPANKNRPLFPGASASIVLPKVAPKVQAAVSDDFNLTAEELAWLEAA